MSTATLSNAPVAIKARWERAVPVYGFPVVNRSFLVLVREEILT